MDRPLRNALITSRSAAVAVALLTAWAIINLVYALAGPVQHLLMFIGTAIAILDIPTPPSPFEMRMVLLPSSQSLLSAATEFGMAWLVSKAVYGVGPLAALQRVHEEMKDAGNA